MVYTNTNACHLGVFQRVIPCVVVYIDDILVTGKMTKEYLKALDKVLSPLEKAGLCLQKQKCSFMQTSVTYLGRCKPVKDKLVAQTEDTEARAKLTD